MTRRPSDRTLRRWLATGRPKRIVRVVSDDPVVATRLDDLTALSRVESDALEDLLTPPDDFEHRTAAGVQQRVDNYSTTATVVDLLGLGFHVGRAVMGDRRKTVRTDDDSADQEPTVDS